MVQVVQIPRSRGRAFAGEIKPVALALGLAFGLGVGTVPAASAATITVNNLSGTSVVGQCTLRDAVQAANTDAAVQGCAAGSGPDIIDFSVTGVIPLASQITISSSVTISGPGAASLTLATTGTNRALYLDDTPPSIVTISGVTFQGNPATTATGGAIFHYGGALFIQDSVFTGNVTTGRGGAIFNYGGGLEIVSSTFTANRSSTRGGAIFMYSGALRIQASTFTGNIATGDGGAIYLYGSGALTMTDSTLSGNQAAKGGAIYFYSSAASTITNSTISGNSATGNGGGIYLYDQTLTISNSTLTGNTAGGSGGGVYLYGSTLNLFSTIIANSTDGSGTRDIAIGESGSVNATNSLVFNPAGNITGVNLNNIIGQNPLLGPLANNGGPTMTHALLPGSPAIGTGINPQALAFDQRGTPFARSSGLTDIGAFEVQGAPPPPAVVTPVPTLSQWGVVILSVLMAGWAMLTGFGRRRRR